MEAFNDLSNTYFLILFFIVGLFFGSFFNVVGLRLPKNKSIAFPPSHCPKCNHELSWYELLPVFSYIFLKGRCKACKSKISILYPTIELLTGILFSISFYVFGLSLEMLFAIIFSSTILITMVSDIKYMIIPDEVLLIGAILLLIVSIFIRTNAQILDSLTNAVIAAFVTYLIKLLGDKLFKKESMGSADIKLMALIGFVLPGAVGALTIFFGSILALPVATILLITKKQRILPFGPFLGIASLILLFLQTDIAEIINLLI